MNKKLLITFGCSWTQGVGVGYQQGMNRTDYEKIAWDKPTCNQWSYRGLLCKQYDLDNLNFSHGGSSNQAQFQYAKQYFGSDKFLQDRQLYEKIIVLHAITSTARNFYFDLDSNQIQHVKYSDNNKFSKFMVANCYAHEHEVKQLVTEMNFWNMFYKIAGIKNIWIDTFNHHNYNVPIDNLLDYTYRRDLLSQLCFKNNVCVADNNQYHKSNWSIDDDRVTAMINHEILNPISKHPTKKGHQQIADIVSTVLPSLL